MLPIPALSALISAALFAGSMVVYPGGTVWDAGSTGYDLLRNYLCDLLTPTALNAAPNLLGAWLAIGAFLIAIFGLLLPLWLSLPKRLPEHRWPRLVRRAGVGSLVIFAMLPSALWLDAHLVHHVVVFGAGALGFGAAVAMAYLMWRDQLVPGWVSSVGGLALAISVIDLGIYAVQLTAHHEPAVVGPTLQKVALVLILVWLPAVVVHLPKPATK